MALTYTADFAPRFPELATTDSDAQTWIESAMTRNLARLAASVWGSVRSEGALLMTAHERLMVVQATAEHGAVGKVRSLSVDEYSVEYATRAPVGPDAFWQSTHYGEQYLDLRRSRAAMVDRLSL